MRIQLSKPSKMPGAAWGIPAAACITGAKLRAVPGSVCSACYALKGRFIFPGVQSALERNLAQYNENPAQWVEAMADAIHRAASKPSSPAPYPFRWFHSGDLQSTEMLLNIYQVAQRTPKVRHWISTREKAFVVAVGLAPSNVTVRVSATMVDAMPKIYPGSMVLGKGAAIPDNVRGCKAPTREGKCGRCRLCWNPSIPVIAYHKH